MDNQKKNYSIMHLWNQAEGWLTPEAVNNLRTLSQIHFGRFNRTYSLAQCLGILIIDYLVKEIAQHKQQYGESYFEIKRSAYIMLEKGKYKGAQPFTSLSDVIQTNTSQKKGDQSIHERLLSKYFKFFIKQFYQVTKITDEEILQLVGSHTLTAEGKLPAGYIRSMKKIKGKYLCSFKKIQEKQIMEPITMKWRDFKDILLDNSKVRQLKLKITSLILSTTILQAEEKEALFLKMNYQVQRTQWKKYKQTTLEDPYEEKYHTQEYLDGFDQVAECQYREAYISTIILRLIAQWQHISYVSGTGTPLILYHMDKSLSESEFRDIKFKEFKQSKKSEEIRRILEQNFKIKLSNY